jgi:hypothetical protein
MKELHGTEKAKQLQNKHFQQLRIINDVLLSSTPQLALMFSKHPHYSSEKTPGFISVPISDFSVVKLAKFVEESGNISKGQIFANNYIKGKSAFDKAHTQISALIPSIRIARKNEQDFDMMKFTLSILKLVSFLQESQEHGKTAVLSSMIEQSPSK